MPMSWYVQDMLIRDQLAEAERRAAHNRLVREALAHRGRSAFWARVVRWLRRPATPAERDAITRAAAAGA